MAKIANVALHKLHAIMCIALFVLQQNEAAETGDPSGTGLNESDTATILQLEKRKTDALEEMVMLGRERLVVDRERLGVERERLAVERERLGVEPLKQMVCRDVPKVANTLVMDGAMSNYKPNDTIQYRCVDYSIEAPDAHMNVTCDSQGNWNTSKVICKPLLKDCWYLKTVLNETEDGVYNVSSPDGETMALRCDMTTDGGGWTVFQRRGDGSVSFNKNFKAYQGLFGSLYGEFWLGNNFLHKLTHEAEQMLRVEVCDWNGDGRFAKYHTFSVGPLSDNYRLKVNGYSGNAHSTHNGIQYEPFLSGIYGYPGRELNGNQFSTYDVDNDISSKHHCAEIYASGWWFSSCFPANLNGIFQIESQSTDTYNGIQWYDWKKKHSFKGSEMKVRPWSSVAMATASTNEPFRCPVI